MLTGAISLLLGLLLSGISSAVECNLLANGGFETAGRLSRQRLQSLPSEGVRYETNAPWLPVRWTWSASGPAPELRLVSQAHSGQRALRIQSPQGGNLMLNMSLIEVVPRATYRFGVWARGTGQGAMVIYGSAFEVRQELARLDLAFTPSWTEARKAVTIPGHIRTVSVELAAWDACDVTWDDAFFSTDLPRRYDPDAVLTGKPVADEDTIALVDFDSPAAYRLEGGAKLTAEGGGRFGKGLRLERVLASSAVIPLALKRMPNEGTLEFWFAPDEVPEHIHCYSLLMGGDLDLMKLQADTSSALRLSWRTSASLYDPQPSIAASQSQSRDWFRAGQWQHVAWQWDRQAVRYYVNGVLVDYSTDRPLPFFQTPSSIKLGSQHSVYAWSGLIDEVRLSRVQRYGPLIPVGAKWSDFVLAPQPKAAEKRAATLPPPNFTLERKKLLSKLPTALVGTLTWDASKLMPLLSGDADFQIQRDAPIAGTTTALIGRENRPIRDPDNDGGYWKLSDVKPGRYYVGVWYESGKAGAEAPQNRFGALCIYLNGRLLQLSTTSDPLQVAPGVYFAEAQTGEPAEIRAGDEIAVLPESIRRMRVARLTLYTAEPARGHGWVPENYGATWFSRDTALRLNLDATFGGRAVDGFRQVEDLASPADLKKATDGVRAVVTCHISNPLSVPLTVAYSAEVRAYFRRRVGEDHATLTLQPHQRLTREIPFTVVPDSRRYTIDAKARAIHPAELDWPATDSIHFFPGVTQDLPWPNPMEAKEGRSVEFSGVLPGERTTVSLDGTWQTATTTALSPPVPPLAKLDWQPRQVPFATWNYPTESLSPRPHGLYLRLAFRLPGGTGGRCYRLNIARAMDEATIYVNGQKVGNIRGGETPRTCDISAAARPGDNEVLIVVRDLLAIMDPDYVNRASPTMSVSYLDAPGGDSMGGFGLGKVSLETTPPVAAHDLLVMPSVRKHELTARWVVANHQPGAVKARVVARVLDADQPVLELGRQEVALEPGQAVPLTFAREWPNPVLWGPGNAKLYTLAVETLDAVTGKRLDLLRERFGFRECWVEGDRLYLNGAPVRLKGSTCQGGGGVNIGDIQWSRGAAYPDFMDEFGHLVSFPLAAIFNSSSRHNVDRDQFWDSARQNVLAGAVRYGNHPSIIAWDLSNEWLSFLDYGGGDPKKGARRFQTLAQALKQFDPSRWSFFDGDEDLHGLYDVFSMHYMLESANPHPISGFGFRGHSNYFPDGAFYRPLDQSVQMGQEIPVNVYRRAVWRYGEKVLMDTENLWKVSAYMPPGLSKFVGEDDVLGPGIDSGRGSVAWMWKQNLDGHRDLGVSAVCNYTPVAGVARRGHSLQCFIMPDHTHHAFSGDTVRRSYSLHNDLFVPSDFVFVWDLLDPSGRTVAHGQERRRMESGGLDRAAFSLIAPAVDQRTRFTLRMRLLADGCFAYGERRDLDVWPKVQTSATPFARSIVLFDPAGATAKVFQKAGFAFTTINELSGAGGDPTATVLVIGEDALQADTAVSAGKLGEYVAGGGRIVVLCKGGY